MTNEIKAEAPQLDKYPSTPNLKDTFIAVKKNFGKRTFMGLTEDKQPIFEEAKLPVVMLEGTVKLHGTHGDVWLDGDMLVIQSRNRIITPLDDNQGFARFVMENEAEFRVMLIGLIEQGKKPFISGEWAGGNIQGGVALTGIEKSFFIFNKDVFPTSSAKNIYNLHNIWHVKMEIDFNEPEETKAFLEEMTLRVENKCPIGTKLNPNRTNDIGEGLVWKFEHEGKHFMFKTKGVEHQRNNKIEKPKIELPEESKALVQKFLDENVTVDRLEQGIEYLNEMGHEINVKSTGHYIKWVSQDVFKECQADLTELAMQGIDWKKNISSIVARQAKAFFMARI